MTFENHRMGMLLLVALFLMLIGGGVAVFIYSGHWYDMHWQVHIALCAMLTTLASGITAICALAPW